MAEDISGLILIVEDERAIADIQRMYLQKAGFGVHVESDGVGAIKAARELQPACIVLDVGIPAPDGIEVVKYLRQEGNWTPVLMCTARDDEVDRVLGLEIGADDYITKPFSPRELVARVKAAIRRHNKSAEPDDVLELGNVLLNRATRKVSVDGHDVEFTATEFDLLAYLMTRSGRVISREQLLSDVWGYAAYASNRTVDTHIAQVRAKLGEKSFIRTVRGVGYSADLKEQ
ncbi:MAG: response regulator transcription factor [Candidatus Nanopelagicales bacterium]